LTTGTTSSFWTPGASFFAIAFTRLHGRTLRSDAVTSSTLMSALGRTGRWRQVLEMTRGGCGCGDDGSRLVLKHGLKWARDGGKIGVELLGLMIFLCATRKAKKTWWDGN